MNQGNESDNELLRQIRDLLVPISGVYQPQYAEVMRSRKKEQVEAITQTVGKGAKRLAACKLMDGSRTRKEIAKEAKIDSGELSRFLKALKEDDLVEEEDGKPQLAVEPSIVWSE